MEKQILTDFYTSHPEDARFDDKANAVEFIVTKNYIDRYLKPGHRILEVGCGTGRYTLHYARRGYQVDALELLPVNLEVLRGKLTPEDNVNAAEGNALDLSRYADNSFDIVLVLGPMYHLFTEADKLKCLGEAVRVAKPGGKVFVAYTHFDPSMIQQAFGEKQMFDFLTEAHLLDPDIMLPISNPEGIFEMYRQETIDGLIARLNVKRLHYVGVDMFAHYHPQQVNNLDDRLYQLYLQYTLSICENPHLVGASNHGLDILEKLPG